MPRSISAKDKNPFSIFIKMIIKFYYIYNESKSTTCTLKFSFKKIKFEKQKNMFLYYIINTFKLIFLKLLINFYLFINFWLIFKSYINNYLYKLLFGSKSLNLINYFYKNYHKILVFIITFFSFWFYHLHYHLLAII